ncbi:MAG: hypothetical protein U0441_10755 [Polyangiaceae bacterium]
MSTGTSKKDDAPNWLVDWLKPNFSRNQYLVYLIGCVLFSFGACCFIEAKLGTDPLDVFSLGLQKQVPAVTIGAAQGGFAAIMLAIWAIWNRKLPIVSPFVTFFFCGTLIDFGRHYKVAANVPFAHSAGGYPLMILGVFVCAYASSYIIMSGIGIRAMDLVAITMVQRWKAPFWVWKTVLESCLLLSGYLMGGPVGVGTLCFLGIVDLLIQPMMIMNQRFFGMRNMGLRGKSESHGAAEGAHA